MNPNTPVTERDALPSLSERVARFSDHLRIEHRERELQRDRHRAELRDSSNPPRMRISVWEKLHGLQLPSEPSHPILFAIANDTRLSIAQVHDEQTARAALEKPRVDDEAVDLSVYAPAAR